MGSRHGRDEELAAVCVRAGVGHAQQARHLMIHHKSLVLELVPVNAVASVPLEKYFLKESYFRLLLSNV